MTTFRVAFAADEVRTYQSTAGFMGNQTWCVVTEEAMFDEDDERTPVYGMNMLIAMALNQLVNLDRPYPTRVEGDATIIDLGVVP
jgi:hypothetical protein